MNDRGNTHAGSPTGDKRRPLWPWVVGALVLCLFAASFSFWWPIYQANRVLRFAEENHGNAQVDFQHPRWLGRFIAEDTFLPRYDEVYSYEVCDAPIPEETFQTLCKNSNLWYLGLDISDCAPESFSLLETQKQLQTVVFHGRRREIPFDWMKSLPKLENVLLADVSVTPEQWMFLLERRDYHKLHIDDTHICRRTTNHRGADGTRYTEPHLIMYTQRLTENEAERIVRMPELGILTLGYSTSDADFWKTLSRHPGVKALKIGSQSLSTKLLLTATELDHIRNFPALTELILHTGSSNSVDVDGSAWERFQQERPDVSLTRDSVERIDD